MPSLLFACFLLVFEKQDQTFHDAAITPSIAGVWAGSVNVNNVSTSVKITLQQQGALVQGTYTADGKSPILANSGSITGATTGPTFSLSVTGNAPACLSSLSIGGENDGTALSFNLIGTDCNKAAFNGQASLSKQS